jgi:hypothetical protein
MIPKQLAINLAERESKPAKGLANIWLGVLCLTLLLPLLCYGIVDTLEGFPQESKPSADA